MCNVTLCTVDIHSFGLIAIAHCDICTKHFHPLLAVPTCLILLLGVLIISTAFSAFLYVLKTGTFEGEISITVGRLAFVLFK